MSPGKRDEINIVKEELCAIEQIVKNQSKVISHQDFDHQVQVQR